jgi:hypothetical protein
MKNGTKNKEKIGTGKYQWLENGIQAFSKR